MKKRNPDWILFIFNTQQSAKNASFLQNESTNIKETKSTHALFFWSKSQSSHTNIHFICKIVQEANFFFFFFFFKDDINSVPQVRKLVIKTQQWHILYIVLSPLTLYWVLQGDRKHRKSSCANDNANKAKVCMRHFHTTCPNQAVPNTFARIKTRNVNKTKPN